VTTEDTGTDTD